MKLSTLYITLSALCSTMLVAPAAHAEPPIGFRLSSFTADLYNPKQQEVLQVIGDSINVTSVPNRMQVGYRDYLDIPFNAWVIGADNGNSDIGYTNAQSSPIGDVVRDPNWYSYCGPTAFSPLRYRDTVWDSNPTPGQMLVQTVLNTPNLVNMPRGNPFAVGHPLSARFMFFESPCQYMGFTVQGVRNANAYNSVPYAMTGDPDNQILFVDCSIPDTLGIPSVRAIADTHTGASEAPQDGIVTLGARFRALGIPGVQMQVIAHSGWRTTDHLATLKFSDEAIAQFYRATDPPTHVMLWIGQNLGAAESSAFAVGDPSVYRANVRAIMDRHNGIIRSLGAPTPRWLLVSQYKTGYPESYHQLIAQAQFDLAQADPRVSTLNLYRLTGGESFDKSMYLSDGVHPNAAGVTYLAKLMNSVMEPAAACWGDFDGDGFVTGDDFDAFSALFVTGEPAADFNNDGFVTGDDFDQFSEAFIAGC